MRQIAEIRETIAAAFMQSEILSHAYGFVRGADFSQNFSRVSVESILIDIFASAAWLLEALFAEHRQQVDRQLADHHAHTLMWYASRARDYMHGCSLIPFTDSFDTAGMTAEDIASARIVAYAALTRVRRIDRRIALRMKVAKAGLVPLSAAELAAFTGYMDAIGDAGVELFCVSRPADQIRQSWTIYYDPQILTAEGGRVDGSASNVIRSAIKSYLMELPFNGVYTTTHHVDFLQAVPGVVIPTIKSTVVRAYDGQSWEEVPDAGVIPEAGWYAFSEAGDLAVEMIPYKTPGYV